MRWTRPLPALRSRVHYDSGHDVTSWTGTVRGIVDDEWLVLRRWSRGKQAWIYWVEWRWMWERESIRAGALPRRMIVDAGKARAGR